MKILKRTIYLSLLLGAVSFLSCEKSDKTAPNVTLSSSEVVFTVTGGTAELTINSNADWSIKSYDKIDWLQISQTTGNAGNTTLKITVAENKGFADRNSTLLIATANGAPIQVSVTQFSRSRLYPSYNLTPKPADATGMGSTAVQLASKINMGWNIGNTLEAIGGETAWGNPKVTNDLIKAVKQAGFNAIRIPCSWNQYSDKATAKIQDAWLNRVKEVVQYCVNNDVYVILNIHWDGGWLENNCTADKKDSVNDKQKAFWEQIATTFRDFDQHVLFASANEPAVNNADQMDVLLSYHQTFVNAVRSTGGRNRYRVLVIQGPSTDITKTNSLMSSLPADRTTNRMMAEVHYYNPYQFCLMDADQSWGNMWYYWGQNYHSTTDATRNATSGEESDLNKLFVLMKKQFTDKGIPVIVGEFDAMRRSNLTGSDLQLHLDSRAYFLKYVVKQAKTNGLLPFLWDTGNGVINRMNNTVFDQKELDSLRSGAGL
ncbi:cellulase family glycosylhydrolase [Niastella vici]|nr:cellulase family glycosylhydrolase [Niastella vici]